jgi:hypothetical protein
LASSIPGTDEASKDKWKEKVVKDESEEKKEEKAATNGIMTHPCNFFFQKKVFKYFFLGCVMPFLY